VDQLWKRIRILPDNWKTASALSGFAECLGRLSNAILLQNILDTMVKHNEKPTSVKRLRSQADESPNFQFCASNTGRRIGTSPRRKSRISSCLCLEVRGEGCASSSIRNCCSRYGKRPPYIQSCSRISTYAPNASGRALQADILSWVGHYASNGRIEPIEYPPSDTLLEVCRTLAGNRALRLLHGEPPRNAISQRAITSCGYPTPRQQQRDNLTVSEQSTVG